MEPLEPQSGKSGGESCPQARMWGNLVTLGDTEANRGKVRLLMSRKEDKASTFYRALGPLRLALLSHKTCN